MRPGFFRRRVPDSERFRPNAGVGFGVAGSEGVELVVMVVYSVEEGGVLGLGGGGEEQGDA